MIIVGIALIVEAVMGIWAIIFIMRLRKRIEDMIDNDEKAIVVK